MKGATMILHRIVFLGYAALLATGVAGCAVGRHDMPELTDIPEEFGQSGRAEVAERWWVDFDDPALNAVIEEGLAGSPSLSMSWDRLSQAEAMARKAGATWWPSISADGTAIRSRQWGDEIPESYSNTYTASGTVSYEVDLWGRFR